MQRQPGYQSYAYGGYAAPPGSTPAPGTSVNSMQHGYGQAGAPAPPTAAPPVYGGSGSGSGGGGYPQAWQQHQQPQQHHQQQAVYLGSGVSYQHSQPQQQQPQPPPQQQPPPPQPQQQQYANYGVTAAPAGYAAVSAPGPAYGHHAPSHLASSSSGPYQQHQPHPTPSSSGSIQLPYPSNPSQHNSATPTQAQNGAPPLLQTPTQPVPAGPGQGLAAYAYPGAATPGSSEAATAAAGAGGAAGVAGTGQPTPQQVAQEAIAKTMASLTPEQVAGGVVPVADNRRGYLFGTLIGQVCGFLCVSGVFWLRVRFFSLRRRQCHFFSPLSSLVFVQLSSLIRVRTLFCFVPLLQCAFGCTLIFDFQANSNRV